MLARTILSLLGLATTAAVAAPLPEELTGWPSFMPRAHELRGRNWQQRPDGSIVERSPVFKRELIRRTALAAPRFVIYSDKWQTGGSPPPTADLPGWNVFALCFWWPGGPQDMAQGWQELTAAQRTSVLTEYHNAGIYLVVAAYGSVPTPTSSGDNPTTDAQSLASWINTYGPLDGADLDYEDFNAFNGGTAEAWIISFTQAFRAAEPNALFSHAPVAPWFTDSGRYAIPASSVGGYLYINQQVGSDIDWYNVQFYNQDDYTTCDTLLTASGNPDWPDSALFQIAANGVDENKLVLGKPGSPSDANNGYVAPSTLATCVSQAKAKGWKAGLMVWQYPDAPSDYVEEVWGSTPNSGSGGSTTTTTATTTTTSSGSGGTGTSSPCTGVSAWNSATAYSSGAKVTYVATLWTANQWNENEVPGGSNGAWNQGAQC